MTALVPSETACLASSPGRRSLTAVWTSGGKGSLLVVSSKLGGFKGDSVEDIVDEGVQDGDTLLGDTSLRVNLFQHLVDV